MKWPEAKLGEICVINPNHDSRSKESDYVSFVPMSAFSDRTGAVEEEQIRPYNEVSKGFTPMCDGDVLVAKITPCFENGKIGQAKLSKDIGFGSTEFHVLRPIESCLEGRFLHHFLRQPRIRVEGQRRMTGSGGQRRVPRQFLESLKIPLPPLEEQKRIAALLDKAEEVIAKRRAAIALLDQLPQSLFLEMFGDPIGNSKGWPVMGIETVCKLIVDCVNRTAPVVSVPTPYKMIRTSNVKSGKVDLSEVKYVSKEVFERWNRRAVPVKGDVLLTREAPVGEVGIIDSEESVFLGQRLMLYRPDQSMMTSQYLLAMFRGPFL